MDALLAHSKTLESVEQTLRLSSHRVAFKREEQEATAKIETAFRSGGLATPAVREVLANSGVDPNRARTLLQFMLRDSRLVRVSDELVLHASAMQSLRACWHKRKARVSVPEFKEWTGISRKYAIPLLEFLDRERITRREGTTGRFVAADLTKGRIKGENKDAPGKMLFDDDLPQTHRHRPPGCFE